MTAEFACRNNDQWPKAKRSTLAAIETALIDNRHMVKFDTPRIDNIRTRLAALELKLKLHNVGANGHTAADVYNRAVYVAAVAIRLIEEGSLEYRYASDAETSEPDLFKP